MKILKIVKSTRPPIRYNTNIGKAHFHRKQDKISKSLFCVIIYIGIQPDLEDYYDIYCDACL